MAPPGQFEPRYSRSASTRPGLPSCLPRAATGLVLVPLLRSAVKRILAQYGYPPDLQAAAADAAIKQTALLCEADLLAA
ncbi:MAG: DUF3387 domain-containing protein [Armatimonadetes bacterium]|nr:DUF3387 domain-containing protein [Armatimonadota bacterium]